MQKEKELQLQSSQIRDQAEDAFMHGSQLAGEIPCLRKSLPIGRLGAVPLL